MYRSRGSQLKGREHGGEVVNSHIPQTTRSKVPPTAPGEWDICWMVRPIRGWTKPQVPLQSLRHRWRVCGAIYALGPPKRFFPLVSGSIRPDVNLPYRADRPVPNPFVEQAVALKRHALIAHLRSYLRFPSSFGKRTGFEDGSRQRFLAIDMFSE